MKFTGGARLGWVHASWGLANLKGSERELTLSAWPLGSYTFTPDQVISLQVESGMVGGRISINHTRTDCPRDLSFSCMDPAGVVRSLEEVGFKTSATATVSPVPPGTAFRWSALIAWIILWNALGFLDFKFRAGPKGLPGPFALADLWVNFLIAKGTPSWPVLQRILLKPGRHVGEVAPFLRLLAFLFGVLGTIFTGVYLFSG